MVELEITCIVKNGPLNDCTCITSIQSNGIPFTVEEVISGITKRDTKFYMVNPKDNSTSYVIPIPEQSPTYIRTKVNDTPDDNLLQLPECKK